MAEQNLIEEIKISERESAITLPGIPNSCVKTRDNINNFLNILATTALVAQRVDSASSGAQKNNESIKVGNKRASFFDVISSGKFLYDYLPWHTPAEEKIKTDANKLGKLLFPDLEEENSKRDELNQFRSGLSDLFFFNKKLLNVPNENEREQVCRNYDSSIEKKESEFIALAEKSWRELIVEPPGVYGFFSKKKWAAIANSFLSEASNEINLVSDRQKKAVAINQLKILNKSLQNLFQVDNQNFGIFINKRLQELRSSGESKQFETNLSSAKQSFEQLTKILAKNTNAQNSLSVFFQRF
jgi:hypothetical protein